MHIALDLDPTSSGTDWFDLHLTLRPEDTTLTTEELQLLLDARGGFIFLSGKGWRRARISLTDEQTQHIQNLGLDPASLKPGNHQRVHTLQLADDRLLSLLPEHHADHLRTRLEQLRAIPLPPLPKNLNATLRPYQTDGFHFLSHLAANSLGGILADDMGLGKTVQALAWLLHLAHDNPSLNILIICPKSVVPNWHAETTRFAPALLPKSGKSKKSKSPNLQILNYAQLRRDADELQKTHWHAIILDEAQHIKNPLSLTAKAARSLPSTHRLILTGTPVENSPLDLWSLFAFAMPGLLGTQAAFKRNYEARDPLALARLARRVQHFFDSQNTVEIRSLVMVVEAEELRVREALFTGERAVRLANRPLGGEEGEFDGVGAASGVRVYVNGREGAPLEVGKKQIVTAVFPASMPLSNAVVGNDPGLLAWRRGFSGVIHEAVLLGGGEPSEKVLRGMESALAVQWNVSGVAPTKDEERRAAQSIPGFSAHGVWATIFMIR